MGVALRAQQAYGDSSTIMVAEDANVSQGRPSATHDGSADLATDGAPGSAGPNEYIGSTAPPQARAAISPASEVPPARASPAVSARAVAATATTLEAGMRWCSTLSAASSASADAARPRRRTVVGRPPGQCNLAYWHTPRWNDAGGVSSRSS